MQTRTVVIAVAVTAAVLLGILVVASRARARQQGEGTPQDVKGLAVVRETARALDTSVEQVTTAQAFPQVGRQGADLFLGMNPDLRDLSHEEIAGRNAWMLWTGGNEQFWDWLARHGMGLTDLLKVVTHPRDQRFVDLGVINEPGYRRPRPDEYQHGLAIDVPIDADKPEPVPPDMPRAQFERLHGRSTGIVGLRLFPNPAFTGKAVEAWKPEQYVRDPSYFEDRDLVRPFRIGMSCAFCHASFHPRYPPADPAEPAWRNLSGTIGAQYLKERPVFGYELKPDNILYWMLEAARPGTIDTSLIATDGIVNPTVMNPLFNFQARLDIAANIEEDVSGHALKYLAPENVTPRPVPHVLMDGADAAGVAGALERVYVNIGEFYQHWNQVQRPLVGFQPQRPFDIAIARKHSPYWNATHDRWPAIAAYFKRVENVPLEGVAGSEPFLRDEDLVAKGREVFARNCYRCHASYKNDITRDRFIGARTKLPPTTEAQRAKWVQAAAEDGFLDPKQNYFSIDQRISTALLRTNVQRALARNALRGNVWNDFTSDTYWNLPSVGTIATWDPFSLDLDGTPTASFDMPAGGRGYYRVPTLVGIWATAPFLHTNALGIHTHDPSVAGRMAAFDDAIQKLLWPEKRKYYQLDARGKPRTDVRPDAMLPRDHRMAVTGEESWLVLSSTVLPDALASVAGWRGTILDSRPWLIPALLALIGCALFAWAHNRRSRRGRIGILWGALVAIGLLLSLGAVLLAHLLDDGIRIGPIPKGTPVALLLSADQDKVRADRPGFIRALRDLNDAMAAAKEAGLEGEALLQYLKTNGGADVLRFNAAPDFRLDRGHLFGTEEGQRLGLGKALTDDEKWALIAFLKRI